MGELTTIVLVLAAVYLGLSNRDLRRRVRRLEAASPAQNDQAPPATRPWPDARAALEGAALVVGGTGFTVWLVRVIDDRALLEAPGELHWATGLVAAVWLAAGIVSLRTMARTAGAARRAARIAPRNAALTSPAPWSAWRSSAH